MNEYAERPIEEVPEEYREKIRVLREYGLGEKKKITYNEIIEWLEAYEGKMPRKAISIDRKHLKVEEMTEQEKYEVNLRGRWNKSPERKILYEYAKRPIEEVPEEYREKIAKLRELIVEKTTYEEIIEWLETHERKMPLGNISRDKKVLKREEMTEDEKIEVNLYAKWKSSLERKILDEYDGRPIEEVPEEYREKIAKLRELIVKKTTYEEIIEWLETHEGKMPRFFSMKKASGLTKEQQEETHLYGRWLYAQERKILNEYAGRPIEEVPEEYREKIAKLRELIVEKTTYEEITEWLKTHEGKMPRSFSVKKASELTKEQQEERNLYARWSYDPARKILNEYAGKTIEEVPEEYREKIAKLRSLGQSGTKKDDKIKGRMKKAVGKAVGDNEATRQELGVEKRS